MNNSVFRNRIFLFGPVTMPCRVMWSCLDSFYSNSSCDVVLVTSDNLSSWLVSALHPAYTYLSFTHRADYLRCYFMHHYGGSYSDIKYCSFVGLLTLGSLGFPAMIVHVRISKVAPGCCFFFKHIRQIFVHCLVSVILFLSRIHP